MFAACQAPFLTEQSNFFCSVQRIFCLLSLQARGSHLLSSQIPKLLNFIVVFPECQLESCSPKSSVQQGLTCAKICQDFFFSTACQRCHYGSDHPTSQKQWKIFVSETYLLQMCIRCVSLCLLASLFLWRKSDMICTYFWDKKHNNLGLWLDLVCLLCLCHHIQLLEYPFSTTAAERPVGLV